MDILVLAYHAISESWPAALSVAPARLEAQLQLLARRGYQGATVHDAVHDPPAEKTVAVTFDDAYRSTFELAFPILERVGFPGTVFVATDFPEHDAPMSWPGIDRWLGGPHEHELKCLSWPQLSTLVDAGWEVGSHGRTHPDLTVLSDERLEQELIGSRERCEREVGRCRSLAYPYGLHDARVVQAARDAGFTTGCTVPDRLVALDPLYWPRVGIWRTDGPLTVLTKVSPLVRRIRATAAAEPLLPMLRWLLGGRRSAKPGLRLSSGERNLHPGPERDS